MLLIKKISFLFVLLSGTYFLISVNFNKEINPSLNNEKGYTLTVIIKNLRNNKGRLQVDLYKNNTEFEARMSDSKRRAYVYKKDAVDGTITYVYKNIIGNVYGVACFDDENSNGKIDYGWLLPSEGFGFGGYWHTKWSSPNFNDFKFTLNSDKTIVMKVKYL